MHKNHPRPGVRLYQPIWEQLKREREVKLDVHQVHLARVKKAIIKEKDRDVVAKQLAAVEGERFYLQMKYDSEKSELTVVLIGGVGIEEVSVDGKEAVEKLI